MDPDTEETMTNKKRCWYALMLSLHPQQNGQSSKHVTHLGNINKYKKETPRKLVSGFVTRLILM